MQLHTTSRRRFLAGVGVAGVTLGATPAVAAGGGPRNFRAHLAGRNEVPPVETDAQGQALFQLNPAGNKIRYKLIVANIEDVIMAHIHVGPPDDNGPVIVWLYPGGPPPQLIPGRFDGVLAEGTITDGDVEGGTLDDLLQLINEGQTYVNVHTQEHGGGEIRGQIR